MAEQESRNSPSLGGNGGGGGEDMKEDVNAPINIKVSLYTLLFIFLSFSFPCSGRDISRRRNVFQNQEEHQAE